MEVSVKKVTVSLSSLVLLIAIGVGKPLLRAQEIPGEYQPVLTITGKSGDYKAECAEGQRAAQRPSHHGK